MQSRWTVIGFLLIMLTSVFAGWRQCQIMRAREQPPLRPLKEVAEEFYITEVKGGGFHAFPLGPQNQGAKP